MSAPIVRSLGSSQASSSSCGQEIVKTTLAYGERVVATAWDPTKLKDLEYQGAPTFALEVLVEDEKLKNVVAIVEKVGQIDVLVHNAGYNLTGAVEECR